VRDDARARGRRAERGDRAEVVVAAAVDVAGVPPPCADHSDAPPVADGATIASHPSPCSVAAVR